MSTTGPVGTFGKIAELIVEYLVGALLYSCSTAGVSHSMVSQATGFSTSDLDCEFYLLFMCFRYLIGDPSRSTITNQLYPRKVVTLAKSLRSQIHLDAWSSIVQQFVVGLP